MKKLIIALIFLSIYSFGQFEPHAFQGRNKEKLDRLELMKMKETLDLDNELSDKLFSRIKQFRKESRELMHKKRSILESFYDESSNKIIKGASYKKIISLEKEIFSKRLEFIDRLTEILTDEQITKLMIFESRFRRELADYFLKKRPNGPRNKRRNN